MAMSAFTPTAFSLLLHDNARGTLDKPGIYLEKDWLAIIKTRDASIRFLMKL